MLDLLGAICELPTTEYPAGLYTDEIVVWQLGEFHEPRAVDDLNRIAAFSPKASESVYVQTREVLVAMAKDALIKIASKLA